MPGEVKTVIATTAGEKEWYTQNTTDVCAAQNVDPTKGLSEGEVVRRRAAQGWNELTEKKRKSAFLIFLRQFKNFIIYILLFALVISALIGEYTDAITIFAILFFNALIGFMQEYKAEKAIEALKRLSGVQAKVLRGGEVRIIPTRELVAGDIMLLEEGSRVPADARVLESIELALAEAPLTGESTPVSKYSTSLVGTIALADRKNMVFSGTTVVRGRGKAVVVASGMHTEIGKIAGMMDEIGERITPLQKNLQKVGKVAGIATLIICALVFIVGIVKEGSYSLLLGGKWLEFVVAAKDWFLTAVSLAVAAVPEGLPAIVTVSLAVGVVRMLRRNALIRKLPSVETLGETTVICSDKTGTLTKGEMTVRNVYTNTQEISLGGEGYALGGSVTSSTPLQAHDLTVFKIGVLCNNASILEQEEKRLVIGDPTEAALLVSAAKVGVVNSQLKDEWKRVGELPFSSERKMMSTLNIDPKSGKTYVFTKGAVERVLEHCSFVLVKDKVLRLRPKDKEKILQHHEQYTLQALRVLGFAYKVQKKNEESEERLIFVGMQGMIDPPHAEVPGAIARCKEAGIRVVMITGDHKNTAAAIAHDIGLTGESMEGVAFAALSEVEQRAAVQRVNIFARVDPAHKMLIVQLLQQLGEIVAMTGDGVNDAPAIKRANLGIAMGISGTDVAKDASDMILQDDNFVSIVNAVEEGRGIYDNIKKFVNYLFSCNVAEVLIIVGAILLGWPLPMTAAMLLWLNLVTDGLPALALSVDPRAADVMRRPPKKSRDRIFDSTMIFNIMYVSVLITVGVLGVFWWGMQHYAGSSPELIRDKIETLAFTALVIMELTRIQVIRSNFKLGPLSNKYLLLAIASSLALQLAVIYTPLQQYFGTTALNVSDWLAIASVSVGVIILMLAGTFIFGKISRRSASNEFQLPSTAKP